MNFAGVGGQPRGVYDTPKLNLMPRFGITYQLTQKTVLRGGYGIFYGFLGQRRGDVITSGFSRNTTFVPTLNNIDFTNTLSNPYPTGILEPLGSAQGALTFVGQSINVYSPKPLMPYMQRWEIGIQQELPGAFLAEIGYVGNRGTHIQFLQNINTTPQKYLSRSPVRDQTAINNLSANIANPFTGGLLPAGASGSLIGTNIARERLLRPYPHFDNIWSERFDGYSWYHSLQTRLERRFSKGFTVNTNYTYSKFMEAAESAQPVRREAHRDDLRYGLPPPLRGERDLGASLRPRARAVGRTCIPSSRVSSAAGRSRAPTAFRAARRSRSAARHRTSRLARRPPSTA